MCLIMECMDVIASRDRKRFRELAHPLSACFLYGTTAFFVLTQMFYVVPQLFDTSGVMYKLGWLVAAFIIHNILGNMCACSRTDTTVWCLPWKRRFPTPEHASFWRYCDTCERLMPPRSWHCHLCGSCILKRDHHCIFTACCIGYNNQRYFFWFNFYMTLGLLLALGTTISALLVGKYDYVYLIKWILPIAFILDEFSPGPGGPIWMCLLYMFNALILLAPSLMLTLQVINILRNRVVFDLFNDSYDLGVRENIRSVMGQRGLWTFLSPAVESPLFHDGIQWPEKPLKAVVSMEQSAISTDQEFSVVQ